MYCFCRSVFLSMIFWVCVLDVCVLAHFSLFVYSNVNTLKCLRLLFETLPFYIHALHLLAALLVMNIMPPMPSRELNLHL